MAAKRWAASSVRPVGVDADAVHVGHDQQRRIVPRDGILLTLGEGLVENPGLALVFPGKTVLAPDGRPAVAPGGLGRTLLMGEPRALRIGGDRIGQVQQAAKVEYVSVQNLSRATWHFGSHHARVERDAELDWVAGGFGSANGKVWIQNDLAGQGATSRVTGAYFADGTQHLDYDTFQEHMAPSTTSDFAFKGALRDTARVVWRGMIRVEEGAQKTKAYQENRNLLLSKSAHADSIPGLEIMANDVRCTHGATCGQIEQEELFYLLSRGIPKNEAQRLIVFGFLNEVFDRLGNEPVQEKLRELVRAKFAASRKA